MKFDIQKASMSKRISAFLFDIIILSVIIIGAAALMSYALKYDSYYQQYSAAVDKYTTEFGLDPDMTPQKFEQLSEAEKAAHNAAIENAQKALSQDQESMHAYSMVISLTLLIASLSILAGFVIWEFAIPLWIGNGQTLGKKIFGVALMRTDGVKVTPFMMFVRTILGKYTIEVMIPVLLFITAFFGIVGVIGTFFIGLILLIQVILFFATRNHTLIHDIISCTVAVDFSSQMIFDTDTALVEYKKRLHAEDVTQQDY